MIPMVQSSVTKRVTPQKICDYFMSTTEYTNTKTSATNGETGVNLLNNKVNNGTIVSKSMFNHGHLSIGSSISTDSGVSKTMPNTWVRPSSGILYIVIFDVTFAANATGYRDIILDDGTDQKEVRVMASPTGATRFQVSMITTKGGITVKALQNSGSALNCTVSCDYFGYNDIPS